MTINVPNPEVLRAGIAHAEADLRFWDQGAYLGLYDDDDNFISLVGIGSGPPPCGTTACLAGHILLAQGRTWEDLNKLNGLASSALEVLGFSEDSEEGYSFVQSIFYVVDDEDEVEYARTPQQFEKFKAHVTAVTGVEL